MRGLRIALIVVVVLLAVGGLIAIKATQIGNLMAFGEEAMAAGPPPETVATAEVRSDNWETTIQAVGTVATQQGTTVSVEVPGTVVRVHFESGDEVEQGALLVELDAQVERAQLSSILSRLHLAEANLRRSQALSGTGAIPEAQVDGDVSSVNALRADAQALRAQIAKKTVRAPFAGRLGIRQVNIGQYLNPGSPVATLESEGGRFVDFTVPQRFLDTLSVGMAVRATVGEEDNAVQWAGEISAIDPTLDPVSRKVRARATLRSASDAADLNAADGQARSLSPGMFIDVDVVLPDRRSVLMVPLTAVAYATYGDSIFVIEDKPADEPGMRETLDGQTVRIARQHFVRLGERRGDFVEVLDGAQTGQNVVVEGAFKLRNGAPVVVADAPANEATLRPAVENR